MLKIDGLSIKLGTFELLDINLQIDRGDYFVLLGKSGTGKTVLLEIIAGLIKPSVGNIYLNGRAIIERKIQQRGVGIVFQDYSVFPHLTVKQNISYSLRGKKLKKKDKDDLIQQYADLMEISDILDRNVHNLSGGELQRVALARMLISKPSCLLLDEPLASLDVQLRGGLRNLLRRINESGTTILHVTHDYEEAIALSNKVAVLHEGRIVQQGHTKEVFQKPANDFVANFTGIKNFFFAAFSSNIARINGKIAVLVNNPSGLDKGKIIIKGEDIILSPGKIESSAANSFQGVVRQIIPYMVNYEIIVDIGIELSAIITEASFDKFGFATGSCVWVSFKTNAIKIIP